VPPATHPEASAATSAAERIDTLLGRLAAIPDPAVRAGAEETVRLLVELYGQGLTRLLELVAEQAGPAMETVAAALADDDLVASLLLIHGLHPDPVEVRVDRALAEVRPFLASHGGDVEVLGIDADDVLHLRLLGSCDGCPSSRVTLEHAVEAAVADAAPEIVRLEVEGVADPGGGEGLIPLEALRQRPGEPLTCPTELRS
jgi:Fe-S cluster biogenesis protein NfuA